MRRAVAVALAGLAVGSAAASDDARWYAQVDNDVPFATDRWYSSGVRLARVQPHADHAVELGLVQEIYSPEAKYFAPHVVDRRPAARLLLSAARHDVSARHFQTLELAAGVRGPAAQGEGTTDLIHRVIPARFVDWSREGPNRFDGRIVAARTHSLAPFRVHYGAVLGNQVTYAHAGFEVRTGRGDAIAFDSPLLRHAPTPPGIGGPAASGWSLFAGASARAVARNELLDEGYREGGPAPERRDGVLRVAAGFSAANAWGAVVLALAQESREFAQQRVPHRFGSLTVHVPF
ncbi:MAG TPA: lipid A-modifier LpxR family protein [Usitatibacter sp.]|nr:lipid A-modifier LpxR family protein [Usitatibacter sp.]